jgi:ligand-binding sensor domain-containing protein
MWRNKKRLAMTAAGAVVSLTIVLAAIFGGNAVWRAQSVLRKARDLTAAESSLRFTAHPLDAVLPTGLESLGAPVAFTDAVTFNGHLYVAGPSGLAEYDNDILTARYRAGIELPPAPITALAVGLAGDSHAPELWIATAGEGLVAFDGRSFRQIRPDDPKQRKLTSLLALDTGRILIGTEKAGVLAYDGRELKPFHPSLADVPVTVLAGDEASLWIGTIDRGLLHWKAGALETIADALPDKQVLSIAIDSPKDSVYAGTGLGVAEIQNGAVTRTLAQGYFAQSLLAADGKLWIGTLDEGMVSVPLAARPGRDTRARAAVCETCSIRKILRVNNDVYALASDSLWRGSTPIINKEDAVLADRNITALSMDSSGRLWIGYFDRGLQVLDSASARGSLFEDDHLFCVNRIAHDAGRGISAVATANGLVMFDSSAIRRRVITKEDGLIANQVTDVLLRPDGSAVAATPAGVSFIDASGISSIYAFQGLVNNHVYALAADGARTLAGTLGGLSILDGPIVKASFTTSNSALKHNWVTAIVKVPNAQAGSAVVRGQVGNAQAGSAVVRGQANDWFVGTYGAGVIRMDSSGRMESFADLRGQIEINSNAMAVTDRAVYAGTLDRGLAVYNMASQRWNFWTRGLPSANVTAVEARGGVLYIGTDNGLVKVPETTVFQ